VQRINQRQGFLVSAVVHLTFLMILVSASEHSFEPRELEAEELERREVVFLPRPEVLRQLAPAPAPPPPAAVPRPAPTPPPQDPEKKDRISIGPPTEVRRTGPMILRREDDLTKAPKGQPDAQPQPAPVAPTPPPRPTPVPKVADAGPEADETPGKEGLRLPPGLLGPPASRGDEGSRERSGSLGSSMDDAVDDVTRRLNRNARLGIPTGTGQSIEGLRFDPRGADFTVWINDFKNQVYRNWNVPQAAFLGYRGHVDFEFTVERDGSLSALRMLKPSGTSSFDRAARNSLTASRFMALPDDYGPPRVTMQVTFYYNEGPRDS
jgi:TonB family protein